MSTPLTRFIFDGFNCYDPRELARQAQQIRQRDAQTGDLSPDIRTDLFVNWANAFRHSTGVNPGQGWVLMRWKDLKSLDINASHTLQIQGGDPANSISISPLYIVNYTSVSSGKTNYVDPGAGPIQPTPEDNSIFIVEVFDERIFARHTSEPQHYNILEPGLDIADGIGTNQTYYDATTNGGTPWTWLEMLTDIWTNLVHFGAFPGLPPNYSLPGSTPQGYRCYGPNLVYLLERVLQELKLDVILDHQAGVFKLVELGATDLAFDTLFLNAAQSYALHTSDTQSSDICSIPETLRVYFVSRKYRYGEEVDHPTTQDSWPHQPVANGTAPQYYIDIDTNSANARPSWVTSFTTQSGTLGTIYDSMAAEFDEDGAVTNQVALQAQAEKHAKQWLSKQDAFSVLRIDRFSGLHLFQPGSRVGSVSYYDHGHGLITEIAQNENGQISPHPANPQRGSSLVDKFQSLDRTAVGYYPGPDNISRLKVPRAQIAIGEIGDQIGAGPDFLGTAWDWDPVALDWRSTSAEFPIRKFLDEGGNRVMAVLHHQTGAWIPIQTPQPLIVLLTDRIEIANPGWGDSALTGVYDWEEYEKEAGGVWTKVANGKEGSYALGTGAVEMQFTNHALEYGSKIVFLHKCPPSDPLPTQDSWQYFFDEAHTNEMSNRYEV